MKVECLGGSEFEPAADAAQQAFACHQIQPRVRARKPQRNETSAARANAIHHSGPKKARIISKARCAERAMSQRMDFLSHRPGIARILSLPP